MNVPSCPFCGSTELRRVRNYGRPVGNEWECCSTKSRCLRRWDEDERPASRVAVMSPCEHNGLDRAEYDLSYESGDGKLDWCAECGAVRVRSLIPRTFAMGDDYPQFTPGIWVVPVRATPGPDDRKMRTRTERGAS